MELLRESILKDLEKSGVTQIFYKSQTFYMGDPKFYDSYIGLYYGHIVATPSKSKDGKLEINWRAECPWEWTSYTSLFEKYGDYHAQCFPLPNAKSIIFGARHCLRIDDGLGGHLVKLGIAKPFRVFSEWVENVDIKNQRCRKNNQKNT